MKYRFLSAGLAGFGFVLASLYPMQIRAQENPQSQGSDSVAKPKKKPGDIPEPDQQQIPSEYKKQKEIPQNTPTFEANATTVSVDVSVLDNKGRFIPNIPQDKFRVLEDGVPQQ